MPPSLSLIDACVHRRLIPIIGAGVSMSIKDHQANPIFPDQQSLLELAANQIGQHQPDIANAINTHLDLGDMQTAAHFARQGLSGHLWRSFFNSYFDITPSQISQPSLRLIQAIWPLSNRVISLNYDKVLQWCSATKTTTKPVITTAKYDNSMSAQLNQFIKGTNTTPAIWTLHGHIDKTDSLLFALEYHEKHDTAKQKILSQHMQHIQYREALHMLQHLSTSHQLLFVGCNLDDACWLQQTAAKYNLFCANSGPHYALVQHNQKEAIAFKLKHITSFKLLSFEDFTHTLPLFLTRLATQINSSTEVTPTMA